VPGFINKTNLAEVLKRKEDRNKKRAEVQAKYGPQYEFKLTRLKVAETSRRCAERQKRPVWLE
jgi:hypothetical protein